MSKIVQANIGLSFCDKNQPNYLYLHIITGKNSESNGKTPMVIPISAKELIQMVDFDKEYVLAGDFRFTPKYYTYLNSRKGDAISFEYVVRSTLEKFLRLGDITREEYINYAIEHYKAFYKNFYYNENRRLTDFYYGYMHGLLDWRVSGRKFAYMSSDVVKSDLYPSALCFGDNIAPKTYLEFIRELMCYSKSTGGYSERRGGEHCGFWTDDEDKVRPRTSRVYYVTQFDTADKLRFLFNTFMLDKPGAKYKPSVYLCLDRANEEEILKSCKAKFPEYRFFTRSSIIEGLPMNSIPCADALNEAVGGEKRTIPSADVRIRKIDDIADEFWIMDSEPEVCSEEIGLMCTAPKFTSKKDERVRALKEHLNANVEGCDFPI